MFCINQFWNMVEKWHIWRDWAIPFFIYTGLWMWKSRESVSYNFFQGVSISRYILLGGNLHSYIPFSGWENDNFFQISSLSEESNRQRFNSRRFMSQTIILSRTLVFKNLVVHTPVWIKNGIAHWDATVAISFFTSSVDWNY